MLFLGIMPLTTFPCHRVCAGDTLVVAMEHNKFFPQNNELREKPEVSLLGDVRDFLACYKRLIF